MYTWGVSAAEGRSARKRECAGVQRRSEGRVIMAWGNEMMQCSVWGPGTVAMWSRAGRLRCT